jgi:hypothetical protein
MKLGFIITGHLRTFFTEEVHKSFCKWLSALKEKYTIHMVCVVNGKFNPHDFTFLSEYCNYTVVPFDLYTAVIPYISPLFYEYLEKELSLKQPKNSIEHCIQSFLYQRTQFKVGFEILKYLGIDIDVYIKTRFDMIYNKILIPFSNESELFPHNKELEEEHILAYKALGIKDMNHCMYVQHHLNLNHKDERIYQELWQISLGGTYYYNLDIYKNPKIWCFNDYIIIGKADVIKLYAESNELIEEPLKYIDIIKEKNIHVITPEVLLWTHLYSAGLTPIVCVRDDVFGIVK